MTSVNVAPEMKQVLGAMLFGSRQPVSVADMRRVMMEVAENHGEGGKQFAKVTEPDIVAALDQLKTDLAERHVGVRLVEVAGGFRFQTDAECGPWLRRLLDIGKPSRLSRPALETLAIIAYRQPVTRAEIEGVRGVTVDTLVRHLLELQLIRIVGRSSLPGRPQMYGTTQLFLEHFGLKDVKELPGIEQLCRKEEEFTRRPRSRAAGDGDEDVNKVTEEDKATQEKAGDGMTAGDQETKEDKRLEKDGGMQEKKAPEEDLDEDEEGKNDKDEGDNDEDEDEGDNDEDEDEGENKENDKDEGAQKSD